VQSALTLTRGVAPNHRRTEAVLIRVPNRDAVVTCGVTRTAGPRHAS
jgi:hypothetical protein